MGELSFSLSVSSLTQIKRKKGLPNFIYIYTPGPVTQSVGSPIADPGIVSSIPVWDLS